MLLRPYTIVYKKKKKKKKKKIKKKIKNTHSFMRARENRMFRKVFDPVKNFFKFQFQKFRERKQFKYIKCPLCKAQLRVKNQKGNHGVRCPKCRGEFKVKI